MTIIQYIPWPIPCRKSRNASQTLPGASSSTIPPHSNCVQCIKITDINICRTSVQKSTVHVYGTSCQHIYASVIVSDNLNCCSRLICLVLETAAICDIFVRSAVYKSSYLLTYLFISEIDRRASLSTADPRETTFLYQRISAAIQRFNAVCLSNTFTISESPLQPFQTPHTLLNVSHPGNDVPGSKK